MGSSPSLSKPLGKGQHFCRGILAADGGIHETHIFHHAPVIPRDKMIAGETMENPAFVDSGDAADAVPIVEQSLQNHTLHQTLGTDGGSILQQLGVSLSILDTSRNPAERSGGNIRLCHHLIIGFAL